MVERGYQPLLWGMVLLSLLWIAWTLIEREWIDADGETMALEAARKLLEDGRLTEAIDSYNLVAADNPQNLGALRGLAQATMQLGQQEFQQAERLLQQGQAQDAQAMRATGDDRYRQALVLYNRAISMEALRATTPLQQRILGIAYANRGVLRDRMGDHQGALMDYDRALGLEPEVKNGPGWVTRFLRNQAERPPSVADRAEYIRSQLAKPANQRLLRLPQEDAKQRPYLLD